MVNTVPRTIIPGASVLARLCSTDDDLAKRKITIAAKRHKDPRLVRYSVISTFHGFFLFCFHLAVKEESHLGGDR